MRHGDRLAAVFDALPLKIRTSVFHAHDAGGLEAAIVVLVNELRVILRRDALPPRARVGKPAGRTPNASAAPPPRAKGGKPAAPPLPNPPNDPPAGPRRPPRAERARVQGTGRRKPRHL